MEVEVVNMDKYLCEVRVDSITVAEILRVYLNEQGIKFAAWRKEHPSKPVIFKIESSGKSVKKVVGDAVAAIKKDCDGVVKGLKK
jgi:DNA-directed RNA polymerase subunit L